MSLWVLGLTGGIGSGKSVAAEKFEQLGIQQVDVDKIAREVVLPETPALIRMTQRWGIDILSDDGFLNRRLLRDYIFSNPEEKKWLENLLHPLIRKEINSQLEKIKTPYAILNAALLVESENLKAKVSRVLLIDIPEHVQVNRTMLRDDISESQAISIIKSQTSRETRIKNADDIINNEKDIKALHQEIERLHKHYLRLTKFN